VGAAASYDLLGQVSPGVLIFPIVLQGSVLYIMASESMEDSAIDLRDRATGTSVKLKLASQRAAMVVVSKKSRAVVAKYGF
jgi:hypothetical protein